jgi:phosphoserine phosphatase RsbU/P
MRRAPSLRLLLLLGFSTLISVLVATFAFTAGRQLNTTFSEAAIASRDMAIDNLQRLGLGIARNTAVTIRPAVIDSNFTYLAESAAAVAASEAVRFVVFTDAKGGRLAFRGSEPAYRDAAPMLATLPASEPAHAWDRAHSLLLVGTPVMVERDRIATVQLGFDTRAIEQRLADAAQVHVAENRSALRRLVLAGVAVLLLGIVTVVWVGTWLSRPVQDLAAAAGRLTKGDFSARAATTGPAEIQRLGDAFNAMAVSLEDAVQQSIERAASDRELELAHRLQLEIVPASGIHQLSQFEICAWYEPASSCGGDWWSYVASSDDELILAIGDVVGHGVPAAFATAAACSSFGTAVRMAPGLGPVGALEVMHESIRAAGGGRGMTCFALALNARERWVAFANAAHPFPMRVRPREPEPISQLVVAGSIAGLGDKLTVGQGRIDLEPGDVFVLFTDGLPDTTSARGEHYGVSRLRDRLLDAGMDQLADGPLEHTLRVIRDDLASFLEGTWRTDDITLLLVRYRGDRARGAS